MWMQNNDTLGISDELASRYPLSSQLRTPRDFDSDVVSLSSRLLRDFSVVLALLLVLLTGEVLILWGREYTNLAPATYSETSMESPIDISEEPEQQPELEAQRITLECLPFEIHSRILSHLPQADVISYGRVNRQLHQAALNKLLLHVFVDGTSTLVVAPRLVTRFYTAHTVVSQLKFLKALQSGCQFNSRSITFSEPTLSEDFFVAFRQAHPRVSLTVEGDVHWMASNALADGYKLKRTDLPHFHNMTDVSHLSTLEIHCKDQVPNNTVSQLKSLSSLSLYYRHLVGVDTWYSEFMFQLPRKNQLHTLSVKGIPVGARIVGLLENNQKSIERVNVYHPKQRYLGLDVFDKVYVNSEAEATYNEVESFCKGNANRFPKLTLMVVRGTHVVINRVYGEYVDCERAVKDGERALGERVVRETAVYV